MQGLEDWSRLTYFSTGWYAVANTLTLMTFPAKRSVFIPYLS